MQPLHFAYVANLVILVPVAVPTLIGLWKTDEGRFQESAGWRVLVGALWTAILVLSALGLREPFRFSPVLLLQVIYKAFWLAAFALPRARRGDWNSIPRGIAISFIAIVLSWPWVIPWSYLFGTSSNQ